nr:hypothetical protein [Ruegeria sediminis]
MSHGLPRLSDGLQCAVRRRLLGGQVVRRRENHEGTVAQKLENFAVVAADRVVDHREEMVQELQYILRLHAVGKLGVSLDVGKQHHGRDCLTLSANDLAAQDFLAGGLSQIGRKGDLFVQALGEILLHPRQGRLYPPQGRDLLIVEPIAGLGGKLHTTSYGSIEVDQWKHQNVSVSRFLVVPFVGFEIVRRFCSFCQTQTYGAFC